MNSTNKASTYVMLGVALAFTISMMPAFATTVTYPGYSSCDSTTSGSINNNANCDNLSTGGAYVEGVPDGTSFGDIDVFMYGANLFFPASTTITLSQASATITDRLNVASSGISANGAVVAYLDDPACGIPDQCELNGNGIIIFPLKEITSGSWSVTSQNYAPTTTQQYVTPSSNNYNVVIYGQSQGDSNSQDGTYAELSQAGGGADGIVSASVTETY